MDIIPAAFALAHEQHQSGHLQFAASICRHLLKIRPNQPDATALLDLISQHPVHPQTPPSPTEQANTSGGGKGASLFELGNAFKSTGKLNEAAACYRQAIEMLPGLAEAHNNLGNVLLAQGELTGAVACYRQALTIAPNFANAHYNLGTTFQSQGRTDEAIACYRRTLELMPQLAEAHNNLGNAFVAQARFSEAIASIRRALELRPNFVEAHNNLGNALMAAGQYEQAEACCRRALALKPDFAEAYNKLGNIAECRQNPYEAAAWYRTALKIHPGLAEARKSLDAVELDYVQRWQKSGGSLHRTIHIQDFDAYQKIDGWFDFHDIYDLAVREAQPGAVFVEVGCYLGRSTMYLGSRVALAQKTVSIHAIDPWLGWDKGQPVSHFERFLKNLLDSGLCDIITPLRLTSARASLLFADQSVDFCFIDGDHSYNAVCEDLRCWFPKIRPGGLLAGHDYTGPDSFDVKRAVDEFFRAPVQVSGKTWISRKEP